MLVEIVFIVTIVSEILLIALILVSILSPRHRVWPPPGKRSWQYVAIWLLTFMSVAGIVALAILDWDSFIIKHWVRYYVGGALFIVGNVFALWGLKTLGTRASSGLEYRLVTNGPYRYSRNPQYVGDIVVLLGAILIANSLYTTIACILAIIAFLITPFAEEPWLREKYGDEYIKYCEKTPRYLGWVKRGS